MTEMLSNQKQAVAFQLYLLDRCAQLLQELALLGRAGPRLLQQPSMRMPALMVDLLRAFVSPLIVFAPPTWQERAI